MSDIDEQMVLAHFIVSDDVERSRRFYTDVLGGKTVISGEAGDEVTYVALANSWIIINVGGGPTDDKPTVTLETPPDPDRVSSFLNIHHRGGSNDAGQRLAATVVIAAPTRATHTPRRSARGYAGSATDRRRGSSHTRTQPSPGGRRIRASLRWRNARSSGDWVPAGARAA